ncbi:MAG: hypothetical protein GY765_29505 [bacterium]|nr:hypothetical protein [bacterium]
MSNQSKVRIWSAEDVASGGFPEEQYDYLKNKKNVGVCISGGGTVSMSACVGWLRGLHELGLLKNIRYYSGVSGGSWVGVPFTFLPPEKNLENFLGGELLDNPDPAKLTPELLTNLNKESLNYSITKSRLLSKALDYINDKQALPEDFSESLGENYLSSQGLFDNNNKKYFTLNEESLKTILANNPALKADQFHLASEDRPFMIANATIVYPIESATINVAFRFSKPHFKMSFKVSPKNMSRFEYTPLYTGFTQEHKNINPGGIDLGGGYVESFGFNTVKTKALGNNLLEVTRDADNTMFKLCDMMGSSGSAPAAILESVKPELKNLFACFNYWPVMQPQQESKLLSFPDGGTIENTGIVAMLQRKVPRVIAFDSATGGGLAYLEGSKTKLDPDSVSSDIRQLFGMGNSSWFPSGKQFQVFESSKFNDLLNGFEQKLKAGETVMFRDTYTVMKNDFFGLEGGSTVDILWVYNNKAEQWQSKVTPDVKKLFLNPFPNYFTFFPPDENPPYWEEFKESMHNLIETGVDDLIRWFEGKKAKSMGFDWLDFTLVGMKPSETALLSHLSYWNVVNDKSAEAFRAMMD